MKRDMDFVRELLITISEADKELKAEDCYLMNKNENEVFYHLWLLEQVGFIDCEVFYADNKRYDYTIKGLTWNGQDFLDTMYDARVWRKAKSLIKNTVGETSLEVIKTTCIKVATQLIVAQIGT